MRQAFSALAVLCLCTAYHQVHSQTDSSLDEAIITPDSTVEIEESRKAIINDGLQNMDLPAEWPKLFEAGTTKRNQITIKQAGRTIKKNTAARAHSQFSRSILTAEGYAAKKALSAASNFNSGVFGKLWEILRDWLARTHPLFILTEADQAWLQSLLRKAPEARTTVEEQVYSTLSDGSSVPVSCPTSFASRSGTPCTTAERQAVFRSFDGRCNNLRRPELGTANSPFARFRPAQYDDGQGSPRTKDRNGSPLPNARDVSLAVHPRSLTENEDGTISHYVMQWGQFLDHDLTLTPMEEQESGEPFVCCEEDSEELLPGVSAEALEALNAELADNTPECFSISVDPVADEVFNGRTCQPLIRSAAAPLEAEGHCGSTVREQVNAITSYLDGSQVYGSSEEEAEKLRAAGNGRLNISSPRLLPRRNEAAGEECVIPGEPNGCFLAGDERVNEHPGLVTIHTLLVREHNRIANFLRDNSDLSSLTGRERDEILFQTTRKIVIAQLQKITYADFLPILIDTDLRERFNLLLEPNGQFFTGYRRGANPTIRNSFATAAYRLGHTLINGIFTRATARLNPNNFPSIQLRNVFENATAAEENGGVNTVSAGLTLDSAQTLDGLFDTEIADHLFENLASGPFAAGMDLVALNIQRGRDHGLPGYGRFRRLCGAELVKPIDETFDLRTRQVIRQLYGGFRDADLFPAGISEVKLGDGLLGPTFACILARQFQNLRRGDRFYFETEDSALGFNIAQLDAIRSDATLTAIICNNTPQRFIQKNAFFLTDPTTNAQVDCNTVQGLDLNLFKIIV